VVQILLDLYINGTNDNKQIYEPVHILKCKINGTGIRMPLVSLMESLYM
jgi:hypothetical protein